jgi:hypothetical protein
MTRMERFRSASASRPATTHPASPPDRYCQHCSSKLPPQRFRTSCNDHIDFFQVAWQFRVKRHVYLKSRCKYNSKTTKKRNKWEIIAVPGLKRDLFTAYVCGTSNANELWGMRAVCTWASPQYRGPSMYLQDHDALRSSNISTIHNELLRE